MSWADLDKLAVSKPRPDGGTTLVVRDDRAADKMFETKHLSIVVAISRVARGRHVLGERYGARGAVVYVTRGRPPEFLVAAVTAAGGIVFDGTREQTVHAPLAATVQLDAAFTDLASVVRRRMGAKSFRAALESLEYDVQRRLPDRANPEAWWTAIIELSALAGECVREKRGARWLEAPADRLPLALDLGKGQMISPGKLAQTIVEGGTGSMVSLLEAAKPPPPPAPVATAPKRPGVPLVYERSAVPAGFAWEPLIAEDNEAQDALVVVYPDGVERWTALVKLALTPLDIASIDSPGGYRVAVATGEHAAETVLVPDKMQRVRAELGGPKLIFVGMPARGELVAVDGERATLDDELQHDFMLVVEKRYLDAPERDRVTGDVVIYDERPIGRLPRV